MQKPSAARKKDVLLAEWSVNATAKSPRPGWLSSPKADAAADHTDEPVLELELDETAAAVIADAVAAGLPAEVFTSAKADAGLPAAAVSEVWVAVSRAGKGGAMVAELPEGFKRKEALAFLCVQQWVARVSAWDHHRWVATTADHFWAVANPSRDASPPEGRPYAHVRFWCPGGAPASFPWCGSMLSPWSVRFSQVLHSWLRLDGENTGLLRDLRRSMTAFVMKRPAVELAALVSSQPPRFLCLFKLQLHEPERCFWSAAERLLLHAQVGRFQSLEPREVEDILEDLVSEGLLTLKAVPTAPPALRFFRRTAAPEETVKCFWATARAGMGFV